MEELRFLCSYIILQHKIGQINMTASNLSKYKYPHQHHTFKENVTIIDFLVRPGPNIPHVVMDEGGGIRVGGMTSSLVRVTAP
jgi:hypothetical protein